MADRALVNAVSVRLEVAPTETPVDTLRGLLATTQDPLTKYLAAQSLTRHYRYLQKARHATFYARIALTIAPRARIGAGHYLLGVALLAQSEPREALPHFHDACDIWMHDEAPIELAWGAIAYANALLGCRTAARSFVESASPVDTRFPLYHGSLHLNSGFTYLELREPERAYAQGSLALASVTTAPSHGHKNALYLLGESASLLDRSDEARLYFDTLCRTYYPSLRFTDLLLAIRTSELVNWLA